MPEEKQVFFETAPLGPLIKLASTKILKLPDLPDIVDSDKSNIQIEKFQKEWKRQIKENINKKNTTVTLISVLKKVYGPSFMSAGFVKLGHDILQYTAPILLSLILQFIENGSTDTFVIFNINIPTGIIFAILLFLNQVIQNFFLNAYFHRCYQLVCKLGHVLYLLFTIKAYMYQCQINLMHLLVLL